MRPQMMALEMTNSSKLKLNSEDLPAVKEWQVGKKYKLELEVMMVESELEMDESICARFSIKKAKAL
jgi:hypothetical protein